MCECQETENPLWGTAASLKPHGRSGRARRETWEVAFRRYRWVERGKVLQAARKACTRRPLQRFKKKKKNGLSRLPGRDGGSGERNLEREIGKNPIPLRV